MINKKKWDVLTLSGDSNQIEILSSYIYDKSLGSYMKEDRQLYYFDSEKKDIVNDILEKHIHKFKIDFCWDTQKDEDWHLSWQDNFKPITVDSNLMIIPDWDKNIYNSKKIIKIKPGMAFGTGHHETTFLMIKYLINNIKKGESVLDLGSGSGILSIVSKIYGAKKIMAVEFDSICKDNFFENLKINNINSNKIELSIEDILFWNNFNYDIILANINKNIIKKLIPRFQNSNAKILLSGMLAQDAFEMKTLFKLHNIKLIHEDQYNEWLLMVIQND